MANGFVPSEPNARFPRVTLLRALYIFNSERPLYPSTTRCIVLLVTATWLIQKKSATSVKLQGEDRMSRRTKEYNQFEKETLPIGKDVRIGMDRSVPAVAPRDVRNPNTSPRTVKCQDLTSTRFIQQNWHDSNHTTYNPERLLT
jgi:hypothetical protein